MTVPYYLVPGVYLLFLLWIKVTRRFELGGSQIAGFFLTTFAWCLFVKYVDKNSAVTITESSVTSNNGFFGRTTLKFLDISRMKRVQGKIGGLYLYDAKGRRVILSEDIIDYGRLEKLLCSKRPDLPIE